MADSGAFLPHVAHPEPLPSGVHAAALYRKSRQAMPTEIRIVTTELGAEMARRSFFGEGNILDAFWRDYGLSPAAFTEADIHAISSADGEPIADIRTLDDSNRAADLIVKLVRECCEDPDASLHVSIVGGRKSMGMLMGSALTFYGRDRDRISHTLSENETAPDRRPYPSPEELAANPDVVILADLPFLRLRQILPAMMLSKEYSFSEIVRNSQQAIEYMPRVRLTHDGSRWRSTPTACPCTSSPSSSASTPGCFFARSSAGRRPSPTACSRRRSSCTCGSSSSGCSASSSRKPVAARPAEATSASRSTCSSRPSDPFRPRASSRTPSSTEPSGLQRAPEATHEAPSAQGLRERRAQLLEERL